MSNNSLKMWCFEMTEDRDDDNIKYREMNSKVDLVSVPIEENNLPVDHKEDHPPILDTLQAKLEFQGSIRLSESGKSWNLFKDVLDTNSDLVKISLDVEPSF